MAWKDVFGYVRSMADKRNVTQGETRADDGVPLGARIGSLVQMQQSPLIRAQTDGSLIALPDAAETRVVALSQLKLEPHTELFRLYLSTGDGHGDGGRETFLQLFSNRDGELAEILYCTRLTSIIPETADDQDAYMGTAGYGLGDAGYTLWREQLAGLLADADLANVFGELDRIDYVRDAGNPDAQFVAPFHGREIRIDDAQGKHGLRQELFFMPYARRLAGGGKEVLTITTEIVDSVDGDRSRRGIHVDFVIGIPMEAERIVVQ
jgi:hypothetical protein